MHVASLKMMILWLVKVVKLKSFFRFHCENCRTPGSFALSRFLKGSSRSLGPRFQRATGARKQHQNDVPCRKGAKRLGEKLQLPKKHHNASNRWRIYFLPNLKRWRTLCAPPSLRETKSWNCRNFHRQICMSRSRRFLRWTQMIPPWTFENERRQIQFSHRWRAHLPVG